ncbi:MAG: AAA family ATPase [Candidatus Omnitrophota bacterium]|nr:AAA family ATPase [Candidatus Omnitrophota bacterium]
MNAPYDKLSNILETLLKDRNPKIKPTQSNSYPLFLILDIVPDLVCFSLLNGKPDQNILDTIQKFKNLYSINSNKWADRDLTLVFCKSDMSAISDEQCNKVMLDSYFCRKFIIDLKEDLKSELVSLPFIPIQCEGIIGYQRPISAQTFLMKHGLESTLSKHLVIPHSRSEDGIVQDCFEGVLGQPEYLKSVEKQFYSIKEDLQTEIRLKELELCNFRAYRNSYKFDLNADLVILYGPNGFGKTSFFDGLDFAFTGSVGRFEKRFPKDTARLLATLKHLDAQIEDSFAKATICIDGRDFLIERCMKDRIHALFNKQNMDRAAILMKLIGLSEEPPDLRIDNFARLFRATHLFGQEFQSIASDFHNTSKLEDDTVSRMLALQDYVEAINKSKKVLDILKKRNKELKEKVDLTKENLKIKNEELKRLRNNQKTTKGTEIISIIAKNIESKINQQLGISIKFSEEYRQADIRDCRGKIDIFINRINQQIKDVGELEKRTPAFESKLKALQEAQERAKIKKEEYVNLNEEFANKSKKLAQKENDAKLLLSKEQELHLKKDNSLWLRDKIKEYSDLKKKNETNDLEINKYRSQLNDITLKIDALSADNTNLIKLIDGRTLDIKDIDDTIGKLRDIENRKDEINLLFKQQKKEQENLKEIDTAIEKIKADLIDKKKSLGTISEQYDGQKKQVTCLQRDQSELEILLDKLTHRIMDKFCPVCGTSHQSKEELIKKVNIQRVSQPEQIKLALDKLKNLEEEFKIIQEDVDSVSKSLENSQLQKSNVDERLLGIKNSIQLLDSSAKHFNLNIFDANIFVRIGAIKKEVEDNGKKKQDELNIIKEQGEKKKFELQSLKGPQFNITKKLKLKESQARIYKETIEGIKNEALVRKVSIETSAEVVNQDAIRLIKEIEDIKASLKNQSNLIKKEKTEIDTIKKKINDASIEEKTINKEKEDLNTYIKETNDLCKSFGFTQEIKNVEIIAHRDALNVKLLQVKSLKEELVDFEISLDARETTAAVAKLQDEIKNIQEGLVNIEKEQNNLKRWTSAFNNANKDLLQIKTDAFEEYINQYGPLTSNIQKRLRPVYGFGNIELTPERSGILVNVERKGQKDINPTDYFSESQIQIVLLSLFLSAGLTQTWSSFAPVLLDDPVTHFDDLNAYAFLDLIKGNMLAKTRKSQFIISTCDERLFRLMKQKFNKAGFSTIFYSFESIGEKGPSITCYRS